MPTQYTTLMILLLLSPAVFADDAIPVSILVLDGAGLPITNAWVRVPDTEGRRDVDATTGEWTESSLWSLEGEELIFAPNMLLSLTVSAPGYQSREFVYKVRSRKNQVSVVLPELEVPKVDESADAIHWVRRTAVSPDPSWTEPEAVEGSGG